MKTFSFCIIALFAAIQLHGLEQNIKLPSEIKQVTVYQQGAQIERALSFQIKEGIQEIIAEGLPADIMKNSLQVEGKGSFTILSIHFEKNYLEGMAENPEIKNLRDSLNMLKRRQKDLKNLQEIYSQEEAILLANKKISGTNAQLDLNALKSAMAYFRTELRAIKKEKQEAEQKLETVNASIQRIQQQLSNKSGNLKKVSGEVHIRIDADQSGAGELNLTYIVMNAGWQPIYDLRTQSIKEPAKLVYKANIYQRTQKDWKNIPLIISTGEANVSQTQPQMTPWNLRFIDVPPPPPPQTKQAFEMQQHDRKIKDDTPATRNQALFAIAEHQESQVIASQTRIEFHPDRKQTIPGDGEKYMVHLKDYELDASYTYTTLPRYEEEAFLMARITNWEQYNLLPAPANLFFQGRFLGTSYLTTQMTGDTMSISMGRDKSIRVHYEKTKEFEDQEFIGKYKNVTYEYKITLRNTKQDSLDILVKDQLPVSTHEDISVIPKELSNASYNRRNGYLKWKKTLPPGEEKEIIIRYVLEYPKKKRINL